MSSPKRIFRILEAVHAGRPLSVEQQATLDAYMRGQRIAPTRGRPKDTALTRLRKRMAPVVWFEALRAKGVKQEDAEREVLSVFKMGSKTSLWSHRKWVKSRSGDVRQFLRRTLPDAERYQTDRWSVDPLTRAEIIKLQCFVRALAASECQARFAERYENSTEALQAWMSKLDDELDRDWMRAAAEALAQIPNPTQRDIETVAEMLLAHGAERYFLTAIKSEFSD